ncbi:hypothetical protein K469DRAFT_722060 [Zopfia rhizophila CBS 207.26]|uniref:Uncharacterized protein n=1 Tax=Zopfia rhizophila CBS 207.26 TaxID=1314779 RepID=A0A6A6DB43_9PEZI|nr:hypothetical protein K469DRAFT_722060 [Zopfia rhizophila CBS 207.26]
MCLVKVRQEEDVVVPYRVVRTRSPSPNRHRRSTHRVSRTEVIRESRPPPSSYVSVPTPKPLAIPAPQPVPVFVQPSPPPPPPPASSHIGHHYVEVSPRSSVTSHSPSRSEYVVHEREYRRERRERDYSPESSPRYEHFRYVEPAPEPDRYERYSRRERSRSRARSRSRDYDYDPRGSYRETRERMVIVDDDGRRRREYRR